MSDLALANVEALPQDEEFVYLLFWSFSNTIPGRNFSCLAHPSLEELWRKKIKRLETDRFNISIAVASEQRRPRTGNGRI